MNSKLKIILFCLFITSTFFLASCAKKSTSDNAVSETEATDSDSGPEDDEESSRNPRDPHEPDPDEEDPEKTKYGGTVDFNVISDYVYSDFVGAPMTVPENIVVNINLVSYGDNYEGRLNIIYEGDNGKSYKYPHETGGTTEAIKYNKFIAYSNTEVKFRAVFSDNEHGAVALVIDQWAPGTGDGNPPTARGSVWYKNFGQTWAPHPPKECWFVSIGPYDCRPWPSGHGMDDSSVRPTSNSGYKLLGRFSNLRLEEAFNGELDE